MSVSILVQIDPLMKIASGERIERDRVEVHPVEVGLSRDEDEPGIIGTSDLGHRLVLAHTHQHARLPIVECDHGDRCAGGDRDSGCGAQESNVARIRAAAELRGHRPILVEGPLGTVTSGA